MTIPQFQQSFQHQLPAPVSQVNQQANYQVRPQQFNQQFTQPPLPQVSPLLMPPQPFNPQVPPPTFHNIHPLIALLQAAVILISLKLYRNNGKSRKESTGNIMTWRDRRKKEREWKKKGNKRKKNKKD